MRSLAEIVVFVSLLAASNVYGEALRLRVCGVSGGMAPESLRGDEVDD